MGNYDRWASQIGNRLRKHREASGLSQAEIAARIDTSQQNYQKFETGKTLIGLEYLLVLPQVFGCKLTDLLPDSVVSDYDRARAKDERLDQVISGWDKLPEEAKMTIAFIVSGEMGKKRP